MKNLMSAIIFMVLGAMLVLAVLDWATLPEVWFSYSTDECVQVINYHEGDKYSCENLPNKFHHIWVK
jgi:hypothetical protein